jgi:hypothetical protein
MSQKRRATWMVVSLAVIGIAAVAFAQTGAKQISVAIPVNCPVSQVTVGVETPSSLPSPWWDTPVVMQLASAQMTTVGGKAGILCVYSGSGKQWEIARPLEPDYASCKPNGKSFVCTKKK